MSQLTDSIARCTDKRKKWTFTLEPGQGQTYNNQQPTLYGHSTYERGSVLAGREQRVWLHQWDSWEEARKQLADECPNLKVDDFGEDGGTTHIDVDVLTSHLPDDTDY